MRNTYMSKKSLLLALAAACAALPSIAWGGSAPATVSITATVDSFAEWANASPTIAAADWDGHVTAVNQTRTVTKALTLYANVNTTLTPTAGDNSGILTNGTETLTTGYKITGDVVTPDADYKAAGSGGGQFFNAANTYSITQVAGDGSYALSLSVRAISPNNRAPDTGDYTCGVTLTASW